MTERPAPTGTPDGARPSSGSGRGLSLNARLLLAASLVLAAFLGLTGLALDTAFRDSALEGRRERLQTQVYMLLGAAEPDATGALVLPPALPEPRLSAAGSGLYARVTDAAGAPIWTSPSALGLEVRYPRPARPGTPTFQEVHASALGLLALTFPVTWELGNGQELGYVFSVAEDRAALDAEVAAFRQSIGVWLIGAAALLLLAQGAVLAWSLAPLRRLARQIQEVELGQREAVTGRHPRELAPLAENLNALLRANRARLDRYRNSLADLAHSLKTPLAVLRGSADERPRDPLARTVNEQIGRMHQAVDYQLQRAAAAGRGALGATVEVEPLAARVLASLEKVYRSKAPRTRLQVSPGLRFAGDPGDLTEVLGNLADNAFKWCREEVRLELSPATGGESSLLLRVEDDGPGIPEMQRPLVLGRGARADSNVPGHGIGLAVVRELVEDVYEGRLTLSTGELGGTLVMAEL